MSKNTNGKASWARVGAILEKKEAAGSFYLKVDKYTTLTIATKDKAGNVSSRTVNGGEILTLAVPLREGETPKFEGQRAAPAYVKFDVLHAATAAAN